MGPSREARSGGRAGDKQGRGTQMNTKAIISVAAAAVAAVSLALVPASADTKDEAVEVSVGAMLVLASAETPADAVWDMAYGAERPVAAAQEEAVTQLEETVDLSMG